MTATAVKWQDRDNPGDGWPGDDILILRGRIVRPGTPTGRLSRFSDDVWILHLLIQTPTTRSQPALAEVATAPGQAV